MAAGDEVAREWIQHVNKTTKTVAKGPTSLEFSEANMLLYSQGVGVWKAELEAVLPPELLSEVLGCCDVEAVAKASRIRTEMINYKKVCLHTWSRVQEVRSSLQRVAISCYRDVDVNHQTPRVGLAGSPLTQRADGEHHEEERTCDKEQCDDGGDSGGVERGDIIALTKRTTTGGKAFVHSHRYVEVATALQSCNGVFAAVRDLRNVTKAICCYPRHLGCTKPKLLLELPRVLEVHKAVVKAQAFIRKHSERTTYECDHIPSPRLVPDSVSSAVEQIRAHKNWGVHIQQFVESSCHARGIWKLHGIQEETSRLHAIIQHLLQAGRSSLMALHQLQERQDLLSAGESAEVRKQQGFLSGVVDVLEDANVWIGEILKGGLDRLFAASDVTTLKTTSVFVPANFTPPDSLVRASDIVVTHMPRLEALLSQIGWPPPIGSFPSTQGSVKCSHCKMGFSNVWMERSVCFHCVNQARANGTCPFRTACGSRNFCLHGNKCFLCDSWSCEECGLVCGDGADVANLVARMTPDCIFLDFDRTLASTKCGGSPLVGSHSVDGELSGMMREHPGKVTVVTRNSHREDIETFLAQNNVEAAVRSVKRERVTKADVILPQLERGKCGVFIDDDVREVLDERLVACDRLVRVLFVRSV